MQSENQKKAHGWAIVGEPENAEPLAAVYLERSHAEEICPRG
jgi:hypothetical protein